MTPEEESAGVSVAATGMVGSVAATGTVGSGVACGVGVAAGVGVGDGEALAPREPTIGAAFENDAASAVALGVDRKECPAIFEQHGADVAKVLVGLLVDDDLTFCFRGEIYGRETGCGGGENGRG